MPIAIVGNEKGNRFDLLVDDVAAGHLSFTISGSTMDITSTVVDSAFGGQGLGIRLVRHALDVAKIRHLSVLPTCPFVPKVILRYRDLYLDLVQESDRERFGLPPDDHSGTAE